MNFTYDEDYPLIHQDFPAIEAALTSVEDFTWTRGEETRIIPRSILMERLQEHLRLKALYPGEELKTFIAWEELS